MSIPENIRAVKLNIEQACRRSGRSPEDITLVAVTKSVDFIAVKTAFQAGLCHFGENRIQDVNDKLLRLADIKPHTTWHMIGHLQTNKVKTALRLFDIIQSVDSIRLAELLSQNSESTCRILLEVNLAGEATKSGFALDEIPKAKKLIEKMPSMEIKGLMTIAPQVDDPEELRPLFSKIRKMNDFLELEHLSMGMTDDYEIAIEEGATMVRLGRALFKEEGTTQ